MDRTEYLSQIAEGTSPVEECECLVAAHFRAAGREMRQLEAQVSSFAAQLEKAQVGLQAARGKASALAGVLWAAEEARRGKSPAISDAVSAGKDLRDRMTLSELNAVGGSNGGTEQTKAQGVDTER